MLDTVQAQMLDQEIVKFNDFMQKFSKMFSDGRLSYNMWRSQHSELLRINEQQKEKNRLAEEEVINTMKANDQLKAEGQAMIEKKKADAMILWTKAHTKFKEVERLLDEAEKRRIKDALKDLEKVAVAA